MGESMMILCVLAAGLGGQDPAEPAKSPFSARLMIERFVKREDGVTVQSGTLLVRPGEALLFDARPSRMLIRDGRAVERRAGERTARRWNLSKPENFQPLDLWRLDPGALRERFEVITDRPAEARELPGSVVTAEGKPVPPVTLKPGPSLVVADGADRAEGCARVFLVPRDPKLRERIASIRLSVDRASGLILRAVVDSPAQVLTLTLSDYREVASLEDATFVLDLSSLKVEDR
jgi:hypothetical protein